MQKTIRLAAATTALALATAFAVAAPKTITLPPDGTVDRKSVV